MSGEVEFHGRESSRRKERGTVLKLNPNMKKRVGK